MQTPDVPGTRRGRFSLRALQFLLVVVTIASFAMVVANLPFRFQQLSTYCPIPCDENARLLPGDAVALRQMGLSLPAYALITLTAYGLLGVVCLVVAALLLWRRSNDLTAVLAALTLVVIAANANMGDTTPAPGWDGLLTITLFVWFVALVNLLYLFPDGRFVPRWTRWAFAPWVGWFGLGMAYIFVTLNELPDLFWIGMTGLTIVLLALGGLAQIYRYRRVSNRVERQQTKWVVAGFMVYIAAELLFALVNDGLRPALGLGRGDALYQLATTAIDALTLTAVPLSIGIAIFRYRLWDIDLVIRRTLVYSTLTALLAAAYFGSVAILQGAAALVTGEQQSAWVTVLSTLLIAALFAPVRLAVQRFIDRRFFRRRYDAARTLSAFAATLRDDVAMDELTADLLAAVEESMQPEHAALWVRKMEEA